MAVILVITTFIAFALINLAIESYEVKKPGRATMAGSEGGIYASAERVEGASHTGTARVIKGVRETDYRIPQGVFFHKGHTWANILVSGYVKVGIDDFAQRSIGAIDEVTLPPIGKEIRQGGKVCAIRQGKRKAVFQSPVGGVVCSVNDMLLEHPDSVKKDPYIYGWICAIKPGSLSEDIKTLKIAKEAALWLKDEVRRFKEMLMNRKLNVAQDAVIIQDGGEIIDGLLEFLDDDGWRIFRRKFL